MKEKCVKLEEHLSDGNDKDLNGIDLFDEIKALIDLFPDELLNFETSMELLEFIFIRHMQATFPNLCIALRILNTLTVTVASGERSFFSDYSRFPRICI